MCEVANRMKKLTTENKRKQSVEIAAIDQRTQNIIESGGGSAPSPPREEKTQTINLIAKKSPEIDSNQKQRSTAGTISNSQEPQQQPEKYYRTPPKDSKSSRSRVVLRQSPAIMQSPVDLQDEGLVTRPRSSELRVRIAYKPSGEIL